MLTKAQLHKSLENLQESFTIDQLIEQFIFIEKLDEGLKQSHAGQVISDEDVKLIINKWTK
jgi:hypothetical protein